MKDETRVVGLHLPIRFIDIIDRAVERELTNRATWLRSAVLQRMHREGLVRVERECDGSIASIAVTEAAS